jgi:hypothetical protein
MKKEFDNYVEESLKSIQTTKRVMYPRGLELNDDFINSFQKQVLELREVGLSDNKILARIKKSLDFHIPSE